MDRRTALMLGGVSIAATAVPAWLVWSFGRRWGSSAPPLTPLARAIEDARACGKPVLVFVVPDDPALASDRGWLLADALEAGGVELTADLALCEVACATRRQLLTFVGYVPPAHAAGLIDGDGPVRSWSEVPLRVSTFSTPPATLRADAEANARALHEALAGTSELLARRAERARRTLPVGLPESVLASLESGGTLASSTLDSAAAVVRAHERHAEWSARLASAAESRICKQPPYGARWATDSGCGGPEIEFLSRDDDAVRDDLVGRAHGEPPAPRLFGRPIPRVGGRAMSGVLCGMGFSPRLSRRFLFFYTDEV